LEGGGVGVVTMTEKGHHLFYEKNRVTPSVTMQGDTYLSDATAPGHSSNGAIF